MKIISGNKKANGYARYKKFVDVLYESGKIDLKRRSELLKKASTLLNEGLLDKGKEFLAKKTKGALEGAAGGDVMEKAGEQAGKVFSGIMGGLVSELMKDESFKATIKDMTKNMDLSQMKEMAREMAPEMKEMIKDNVEMAAAREGIEEGEEGDEERGLIQEEDEGGEETLNESLNNFEEIRARFKQALIKRNQNLANKEEMKESHNRNDRRRYVKEDLVHDPIRGNYEDPDFHAAGPLDEEDFERSMYHHAYPGTAPSGKTNIMKNVLGKWAAAGEKEKIYDILNSKDAYELLKVSPDMFDNISDEDLEDLYMGCPKHIRINPPLRAWGILRDERERRSNAGWTEEREAYANMMTEGRLRKHRNRKPIDRKAAYNLKGLERMSNEDEDLTEAGEYMSRKYPARLSNEKAPAIDTLPGKGENLSKERLRNYLANKKKRVMEAQKKNLKLKKK